MGGGFVVGAGGGVEEVGAGNASGFSDGSFLT